MTKYLAIAFLITGFLVGDAYGGKYPWNHLDVFMDFANKAILIY